MYALLGLAVLQLTAQDASPVAPTTVKRMTDCTDDARIKTAVVTIAGFEVATLRDCLSMDQMMYLQLHRGESWWMANGTTVRYRAANMTEAPLHIRMISKELVRGTLAGGAPAVVLRIDTLHQAICNREGCGAESQSVHQSATVCTLPEATIDPVVACATANVTCTDHCEDVRLEGGVLTVNGKRSFRIATDER